jgi:saccharopine dehydrogenase-like NADP-dependent oxidoreductase
MEEDAFAFENCEHIRTKPFSRPVKRNWPECGREVTLVEHAHDEPVYIGFNREKYFKNCKNAYFKYGGTGIEFSEGLYKAGLLHHEEEEFNGVKISPFDWVLAHVPAAPKDPEVIKEIIDEGIVEDNGAFVCEAYGQKDGKNVMVDLHLCAPGIEEAYEKAKMSGEMYLTGQGAFLYTKLFVNEMITQKGLISSDMLDDDQVEQYLAWAAELGITYNIEIKEGVVCED